MMIGRFWRFTPSSDISARMPPSPSLSTRIATDTLFDRRHHDQGPDHERQHAEGDHRVGTAARKAQYRLQRVERARPDVAEDHSQRREAEADKLAAAGGRAMASLAVSDKAPI